MSTVFILGAGASYGYMRSPTGLRPPLATGFFQSYANLLISEDFEVRVGDIVNHVRDTYGIPPEKFEVDQDIEQFMTHLDLQLRHLAKIRGSGGELSGMESVLVRFFQANRAYDQTIFLIAHVLNEIQNGPIDEHYVWFIENLDKSDTVVTFNWDTLLDRALFESGRWKPDDGYLVEFEMILDGGWRNVEPSHSSLSVLKLHGSTNWLVNYVTRRLDTGDRAMIVAKDRPGFTSFVMEPNFEKADGELKFNWQVKQVQRTSRPIPRPPDPDSLPVCVLGAHEQYEAYRDRYRAGYVPLSYFFPPNHPRTNVPLMPLVVPPTSFKLYEEFSHVLDPLWSSAAQSIRSAERIVLIGYSLPVTDLRSLDLLRNAVTRRKPALFQVVNPDPERVCRTLEAALGLGSKHVEPIPKTFEEYVR